MKKIVILVLSLVCTFACVLGLAACGGDKTPETPTHSHNYSWVDNGDGTHKQVCSVPDCDTPNINIGNHNFANGNCVCGKKPSQSTSHEHKYQWVDNGDGTHKQLCSVENCDLPVKNEGSHNFANGNCICGKKPSQDTSHEHKYQWVDNGDGTHKQHCDVAGCDAPDIAVANHYFGFTGVCVCGARESAQAHKHYMDYSPEWPATCEQPGVVEYWQCRDCYRKFSDAEGTTEITNTIIPARHTLGEPIRQNETPATCTENGSYDEVIKCSVCREQIGSSVHKEIPATGHRFSTEYDYDETNHWYGAICEHKTEKKDVAEHNFVNGVCSDCGAKTPTEGLSFVLNGDQTAYICNGIGTATATDIVIPSSYNGKPVIEIDYAAFENNNDITSVTLSNGVKTIDSLAFYRCSKLTSVTLSNGIETIGDSAFDNSPVQYTEYEGALYLGNAANQHLALIKAKNSDITSCTINAKTKIIAHSAFVGCTALTSIVIPDSVTTIGDSAFRGCDGLKSVTIGKGVESIGKYTFVHLGENFAIAVAEGNAAYLVKGNCLIEKNTKTLLAGFDTSVIPSDGSVQIIGEGAFFYCDGLTSIAIPANVTAIGEYAFTECTNLASIAIPANVTAIGNFAFAECTNLASVIIDGAPSMGGSLFSGCEKLVSATISASLIGDMPRTLTTVVIASGTAIPDNAFIEFTKLESVTIGNTVKTIGEKAFNELHALGTAIIGSGVTDIKAYAFYQTGVSVTTSSINSTGALVIGDYAFCETGGIALPANVRAIGTEAFAYCSFDSITLGSNSTFNGESLEIGEYAFSHTSLSEVILLNSVKTIGEYAFNSCSLRSVTFGQNVYQIAANAFNLCYRLESITVDPKNTYYSSSGNCLIRISRGNKELVLGSNNCVIPDGVTKISDSAFSFADSTHNYGNSGLSKLIIPSSVTYVGSFNGCSNLTIYCEAAEKPSGWDKDWNVYDSDSKARCPVVWNYKSNNVGDDGATRVEIGGIRYALKDGNATIVKQSAALSGAITIPNAVTYDSVSYNVTSAVEWAFDPFDALIIYCEAAEKPSGWDADWESAYDVVWNCKNNDVSEGRDYGINPIRPSRYAIVDGWIYAINSDNEAILRGPVSDALKGEITIPSTVTYKDVQYNVTEINNYAFGGCYGLTSITLPDGLTYIYFDGFYGLNLTSITLPASLTQIWNSKYLDVENVYFKGDIAQWCGVYKDGPLLRNGAKLFINNAEVKGELVIPDEVTEIENFAFAYLNNLTKVTIPASVTRINSGAFEGCTALTIYAKAASKPDAWLEGESPGGGLWYPRNPSRCPVVWDCANNDVADDGYIYTVYDGIRYALKDGKAIVVRQTATLSKQSIQIYDSVSYNDVSYTVTAIADNAFRGTNLCKIVLPNSVTYVGNMAFFDCSELYKISFKCEQSQGNAIQKGAYWFANSKGYTVEYDPWARL